MPSTLAAERITIRLGPFQQSLAIADLEKFAQTGKLPDNLQALSPVLTSQVRELLTKRLQIDPTMADKFWDELQKTAAGRKFISSLSAAIPGSTKETLQATVYLALRQVNGLSVVSLLRSYPEENVTLDASRFISLAVDFNPNRLQSQALGVLLERDLFVKNNTEFRKNFDPAAKGRETVKQQTITLEDRQRKRTIPVDIYWSSPKRENPLVVLSHGFGSNRQFLGYLARHLASYGITVAAIEHPGSNAIAVNRASSAGDLKKLIPASEFVARPQDISFLLDELEKLNQHSGKFYQQFNTNKVTIIGHSLGGYTALALAGAKIDLQELRKFCRNNLSLGESPGDWLQCAAAELKDKKLQLKDKRIQSVIALNPLIGNLFGKKGLHKVKKPVLIVSATADALTPALKHQIQPFNQLRGSKYLLTAIGATHSSISDRPYQENTAINAITKERQGEETKPLRQLIQGVSLAFIKQLTPQAQIYQPFLTPAYAQSLSTDELPLRLTSELPTSIKRWLN